MAGVACDDVSGPAPGPTERPRIAGEVDGPAGSGGRVIAPANHLAGSKLEIDVKGKKVVPEIARLGAVVRDGASIAAGAVVRAGSLI